MKQLVLETVVVAVCLSLALALVALASPGALASPARAALTGLIVGAAFHLGFELAGLNAAYCVTGHACRGR